MKTDWYKFLCDQLHDPQYVGKRVRRFCGRVYDLGTLSGRWGFAGEIIKFVDLITAEQWEEIVKEVTILAGINVDKFLFPSLLRETFGDGNVKVIDEQDDLVILCKDCCKWNTVACPMAGNIETLIMISTMFDDKRAIDYALNRYCSEAERKEK